MKDNSMRDFINAALEGVLEKLTAKFGDAVILTVTCVDGGGIYAANKVGTSLPDHELPRILASHVATALETIDDMYEKGDGNVIAMRMATALALRAIFNEPQTVMQQDLKIINFDGQKGEPHGGQNQVHG